MPFQIVRNDITTMSVDAIVNTTNPDASVGYGVDYAIHRKAGPALLLARKRLSRIATGEAKLTKGYLLPAKYVVHTVCPLWQDGNAGETTVLSRCYENALISAYQAGCKSIAFPLMSAGNLGFPKKIAMQTAISAINKFLMEHDMDVYLVVFSKDTTALSEKLFSDVKSYIDEHYVRETAAWEYGLPSEATRPLEELQEQEYRLFKSAGRRVSETREIDSYYDEISYPCAAAPKAMASTGGTSVFEDLKTLLEQTDAGFSETLMHLIKRSGKKNPEIYKRAQIDRKLFSKIKNNPEYTPEKATVIAFAIALELDLDDTKLLLERAGYTLTHASKFDIIVEFFIQNKKYDLFLLNEVLYEFDQPLVIKC